MGERQTWVCTAHGAVLWAGDHCPFCIGQELEDEAPEPPEPNPEATAVLPAVEGPDSYAGRHRDGSGPSTGPIHRIARSPSGRHQEHDLEPKRWPWALLVGVSTVLALVLGYTWGYGHGQTTVQAQRVHVPVDVVTITSASTRKPGPIKTKTVTKEIPVPGPIKTVVREVPGPTIWSNPTPAPPKTVTRTVTEKAEGYAVVKICLDVDLEEIECPSE